VVERNLVVEFEKEETITMHNGNRKRKIAPGTVRYFDESCCDYKSFNKRDVEFVFDLTMNHFLLATTSASVDLKIVLKPPFASTIATMTLPAHTSGEFTFTLVLLLIFSRFDTVLVTTPVPDLEN